MKYFVCTLFLLLFCETLSAQDVLYEVASPNSKISIQITGEYWKENNILLQRDHKTILLFSTMLKYDPLITWLNNNIVKVGISCGSPCFYDKYIQADPQFVSNEKWFVMCDNAIAKKVVSADLDKLLISEMLSNKTIKTIDLKGLIPWGENECIFLDAHKIRVTYTDYSDNSSNNKVKTVLILF